MYLQPRSKAKSSEENEKGVEVFIIRLMIVILWSVSFLGGHGDVLIELPVVITNMSRVLDTLIYYTRIIL